MTNPLIDKYFELYPEKKEKPKLPRIEDYKGEKTIADELKERKVISASNASITITPKPPSLVTYDIDSGNDSFLQIAEKVKNGEAKVSSMSMERDIMSGTSITFEVQVWDT